MNDKSVDIIECPWCDKKFEQLWGFKQHVTESHPEAQAAPPADSPEERAAWRYEQSIGSLAPTPMHPNKRGVFLEIVRDAIREACAGRGDSSSLTPKESHHVV